MRGVQPVVISAVSTLKERRACRSRGNGGCSFLFGLLTVFLVVFATQTTVAEAKRGCAKFGHSCYGGMGKRANALTEEYTGQEMNTADQEDPAFVFTGPRSAYPPMKVHQLVQRPRKWFNSIYDTEILDRLLNSDSNISPYLRKILLQLKNKPNVEDDDEGILAK